MTERPATRPRSPTSFRESGGLTRDGESRPVEIPALGRTVIFEVVDPGELTDEELAAAADAIANFRRLPRNFFRDRATRAVARGSRSTA